MNSPRGKEQAQVEIGIFTGKKKKRLIDADDCELAQRVGTKQPRQRQKKKSRDAQVRLMFPHVDAHTDAYTHGRASTQKQRESRLNSA